MPASHDRLYIFKPVTGGGLGFVARFKISKGTRILLEVPLFKTSGSADAKIIVLQEVKSLMVDQQRAFLPCGRPKDASTAPC
jgi:hypothetical protein